MAKQGQSNYKGVNAQSWAAMSLFLQYLRDPDFLHIQLEEPKFADFNLVFKDGHRIVCESKSWEKEFNYSHLRSVLDSILDRTTIEENEEILIICQGINKELESSVNNMKHWGQFVAPEFIKRRFSNQQIAVLGRVRFWEIKEEYNHKIVYALFAELLDFWMPQDDLEDRADGILIEKIYGGSANGKIYRREDILGEIGLIKENASKKSGYFDNERVKIEAQLKNLVEAVKNNKSPEWAPNQLSALSSKPDLMFFVLERIKGEKIDSLRNWSDLWGLYRIYRFSFSLFRIFENNLHTPENRKYVLEFFRNNISETRRFYQHDFFDVDVVKIATKVIDQEINLISDVFEIVQKMILGRKMNKYYLKDSGTDDFWQEEQATGLLEKIYNNSNPELKNEIYKLVVDSFNLIEDDGQYSRHTPQPIFDILEQWLNKDIEKRLPILTKVLSEQFEQYYKRIGSKISFKGWEHMGGITSFMGNNYTVTDRHFIKYALAPALLKYYRESSDKESAWKFIHDNCITETKGVDHNRPDFLNRSVIQIIMERYGDINEAISEEAKTILSEFILSVQGIPHKSELIYQSLHGENFTNEKKWALVRISTEKYDTPINPFAEQIIGDLAADGHKEALCVLAGWSKNPEYFKRTSFPGNNLLRNIDKLTQTDLGAALTLFTGFISSDYFVGSTGKVLDRFEAFEWARFLNDILYKDFNRGLGIINGVLAKEQLSENEQILITACLYRINGKPDDPTIQKDLYEKYIDPLLKNYSSKITTKFSYDNPREQIVQFAEKLVQDNSMPDRITKALRIVRAFINDPDPRLPDQDPKDPDNKYNEHQQILNGEDTHAIVSVRGWCAWVLMKCGILEGRDNIPELIDLTERLLQDPNYYVRHMACSSLSQLARIRLTILPGEGEKKLFFGDTTQEALERSKRVDRLAFKTFEEIAKLPINVKKVLGRSIIRVFDNIKTLNQTEAYKFISLLKDFPNIVVAEAAPLFIFYAEFRKNGYTVWQWKSKGYYDDLGPEQFNDQPFKDTLVELLGSGDSEITSKFAWELSHLLKEVPPASKEITTYLDIIDRYYSILSHKYDQHTFTSIYLFIKNNIEDHFDISYQHWKKCIATERKALANYIKNGEIDKVFWWPFSYNGEILCAIYKHAGEVNFLESFELLVDYPVGLNLGELSPAITLLKNMPKTNKMVKDIFDKLINRNSLYYNDKQQWLKRINTQSQLENG